MTPHERAIASWYLVYHESPLASATFSPEQLADPDVRQWWERASKLPAGSWLPGDLGIDVDTSRELQDCRPTHAGQAIELERRVIHEWCLSRTRLACAAFLDASKGVTADEAENLSQSLLRDVTEAMSGRPVQSVSHREAAELLATRWMGELASDRQGLPVPWPSLAQRIGVLPRRRTLIIGGRSSEHKTTTARELAEHVAREGFRALYWTAEDQTADVANRTISRSLPGIYQGELANGVMPHGYSRTEQSMARLASDLGRHVAEPWTTRLRYHDEHHPRLSRVLSYIRAEAARGLDLVVFDFVQLIQPDSDRERVNDNWWRMCIAKLAGLAHELNIVLILTSQIEKTGTKESEGRIPRAIEMPYGAQLRQGAFGCLMVGVIPALPGKLCIVIDKWKSANRNKGEDDNGGKLKLDLDPAHDKITEKVA